MQLRKYWFRMKVTYVEVHRKRLQGRRLFSSMYNACRYRVAIRGYVTLLKSNLKKGFERLKNNAVNIYKAQRVCSIRYKMKLLVNTFKTMECLLISLKDNNTNFDNIKLESGRKINTNIIRTLKEYLI